MAGHFVSENMTKHISQYTNLKQNPNYTRIQQEKFINKTNNTAFLDQMNLGK
jgi:hypothetical protein